MRPARALVLAARRKDRIEALADELDGAIAVACDVSATAALKRLVVTTLQQTVGSTSS